MNQISKPQQVVSKRQLGAHVSASGGLDKAVARAAALGANCLQLFSGSPRVWKRVDLSSFDLGKMNSEKKKNNVKSIFTHSLYLINLASDNPELVQKSVTALTYDLQFDAAVGGSGIVVHLGSHQGRGWIAVRDNVVLQIKQILAATPANSSFLIENSAGQNGKLCSDLEEIRWLLDEVSSPRLGWCLDTCHAFCAGYSLGAKQQPAPEGTKPENVRSETVFEAVTRLRLWSALGCVHVNDSRDAFASGKDRHDNLGDGTIPPADFEYFLQDSRVAAVPAVLEVPGLDGTGPDQENVQRLQKLAGITE